MMPIPGAETISPTSISSKTDSRLPPGMDVSAWSMGLGVSEEGSDSMVFLMPARSAIVRPGIEPALMAFSMLACMRSTKLVRPPVTPIVTMSWTVVPPTRFGAV